MSTVSASMPVIADLFAQSHGELVALQVQTAEDAGLEVFFEDHAGSGVPVPRLAVIPAGSFEYGAAPDEPAPAHDRPRRVGIIDRPFALGVYPVTADEFDAYARDVGWAPRDDLVWLTGNKPVINIRQAEAMAYCNWLSARTGQRYRLPTELEWEYACRAGSPTPFPHGRTLDASQALYNARQGYDADRPSQPRFMSRCFIGCGAKPVGQYPANRWGLHDMMGNVWELTCSKWTPDHASAPEQPVAGRVQAIVTKGGSWFDGAEDCRAAARRRRLENELDINLGFRVLREL